MRRSPARHSSSVRHVLKLKFGGTGVREKRVNRKRSIVGVYRWVLTYINTAFFNHSLRPPSGPARCSATRACPLSTAQCTLLQRRCRSAAPWSGGDLARLSYAASMTDLKAGEIAHAKSSQRSRVPRRLRIPDVRASRLLTHCSAAGRPARSKQAPGASDCRAAPLGRGSCPAARRLARANHSLLERSSLAPKRGTGHRLEQKAPQNGLSVTVHQIG